MFQQNAKRRTLLNLITFSGFTMTIFEKFCFEIEGLYIIFLQSDYQIFEPFNLFSREKIMNIFTISFAVFVNAEN